MPAQPPKPGSDRLQAAEREAAEVLPAPAGNPRFPLMDSLRAIAAISVLAVHVAIFSGGFETWYNRILGGLDIGVPFFFLLSGFLLYRPMLASRILKVPRQRLRDYGRNRFFRIAPAYWLVLTVTAVIPGMYGAFTGNWWVFYGLLQNYPIYTADGDCVTAAFRCGVPPTWSLAIEVFFYLLLPFFAIFMTWVGRKLHSIPWVRLEFVALGLISIASLFIQRSIPLSDIHQWLFFSPLGRGWWFALGMGMAVISVRSQQLSRPPKIIQWVSEHPLWPWGAALILYLLSTYVFFPPGPGLAAPLGDSTDYLIQYVVFGVISALVILPACFPGRNSSLPQRLLEKPVLVRLGLISYGIFLWHYPVMIWLLDLGVLDIWPRFPFPVLFFSTFVVTVILSAITFRLVERPLMRWARRRGARSVAAGDGVKP